MLQRILSWGSSDVPARAREVGKPAVTAAPLDQFIMLRVTSA
jgi:hypothetical protein